MNFWKMRSFMCDFLKIVHHENEKCVHLHMVFWKKGTSTWKMWTFTRHFSENMDLYLKNMDLYAWFSKKNGTWPVNVDLLRMVFSNMWTSTWKMWSFMLDFQEKSRLQPCTGRNNGKMLTYIFSKQHVRFPWSKLHRQFYPNMGKCVEINFPISFWENNAYEIVIIFLIYKWDFYSLYITENYFLKF